MANDNKIEDLIQISKDRFLPKEVQDKEHKVVEYSLTREFAKTKKSFDLRFYSILVIFLLIVIGGAIIITTYVENKNQQAQFTFNIEDINLQEQISSTKREEKNVNLAKEQLAKVMKEKEDKIKEVEKKYTLDIEKVNKGNLKPDEIKSQIAQAKASKDSDIKKIDAEYSSLIAKAEQNVENAEVQFKRKKEKLEEDINKADKIVNNYKRLQQMQVDALNQKHETEMANLKLKYNPHFTEENIRTILKSVKNMKVIENPSLENIDGLAKNKVILDSELKTIRTKIDNYQKIIGKLQKIPYTNSVEPAMKLVQSDTYFLIGEYERILGKLLKSLEILQKYQRAFNQIAEFSVDNGIIIDAGNPNDVVYSLKPVVQVEDGDTGLIFRKSDELVGTMIFEMKYGKMTGRIAETGINQQILPLDKIFIRKKTVIKEVPEEESKVIIEDEGNKEKAEVPEDDSTNTNKEVKP